MHALIIEDEPYIALVIEDHLRGHGFASFDFATSETDAVLAAGRRPPDLITSDVRLAPGCGIAAVAEICRERPVPVVFITASVGEVRARTRDAVAIAKPFAAADLELALSEAGIAAAPPLAAGPSDGLQS